MGRVATREVRRGVCGSRSTIAGTRPYLGALSEAQPRMDVTDAGAVRVSISG